MKYAMGMNLLAFILMMAVAAGADWAKVDPEDFRLARPPRENSSAWKADFSDLHVWQLRRTERQCQEAAEMTRPQFEVFFGGEEGGFSDRDLERLLPLMNKVFRAGEKVARKFKEEYRRPRPYDVDPTLRPCVKKPGGDMAYPSFHAMAGQLGGCLLAEIYPKRREFFRERGKYVGDLRVIAGVHHPSDVTAGQDLGQQLCDRLLQDPEFQEELEAIH